MNTPPDKTVAFLFVSHPVKVVEERWNAKIVFPPSSSSATELNVEVTDGLGRPEKSAVLELLGQKMQVEDGRASLTYAQFVEGIHSVPIWLHRKGREPVPGGLTFG